MPLAEPEVLDESELDTLIDAVGVADEPIDKDCVADIEELDDALMDAVPVRESVVVIVLDELSVSVCVGEPDPDPVAVGVRVGEKTRERDCVPDTDAVNDALRDDDSESEEEVADADGVSDDPNDTDWDAERERLAEALCDDVPVSDSL